MPISHRRRSYLPERGSKESKERVQYQNSFDNRKRFSEVVKTPDTEINRITNRENMNFNDFNVEENGRDVIKIADSQSSHYLD